MAKSKKSPIADAELDEATVERLRKAKEAQEQSVVARAMALAPAGAMVRIALVIVFVLLIVGKIVSSVSGAADHENQSRANLAEIGVLREEEAKARSELDTVPDAQVLEPSFATAAVRGENLAEIQNDMAKLALAGEDAEKDLAVYRKLTDETKGYFTPGSLSGGAFLPQGRWYQPYQVGKDKRGRAALVELAAADWSWKYVPTKSITDSGDVVGVWEARLSGGELLAWVTGEFDPRRGQWHAMVLGLTVDGHERLGATLSDPAAKTPEKVSAPPSERELMDRAARLEIESGSPAAPSSSAPSSAPKPPASGEADKPGLGSGPADDGLEGN